MQDIVIVGAGGFGREVQWLIERINNIDNLWNIRGYIDDSVSIGCEVNGYKVLGGVEYLKDVKHELAVVCAIGNSLIRKKVVDKIINNSNISFPNLIDPSVNMSDRINMGKGNIICSGNILTVNIEIKDFNIINLDCTVGHDVKIDSYVTIYPSANISGNVNVGHNVEIGTGSHIIQGLNIGSNSIIGAGTVVIRDVEMGRTVVGNPARVVK